MTIACAIRHSLIRHSFDIRHSEFVIQNSSFMLNVFPEDDPQIKKIADSIPVKRVGTPGDVARATLFLAAPENGFITGQTLFVCGGASLGSLSL